MGDIGKEFFLSRSFTGPDPYLGTHGIPVPSHIHVLEYKTFRQGQGPEFRDFLLGKVKTGERKPRSLLRDTNWPRKTTDTARGITCGRNTARICELISSRDHATESTFFDHTEYPKRAQDPPEYSGLIHHRTQKAPGKSPGDIQTETISSKGRCSHGKAHLIRRA